MRRRALPAIPRAPRSQTGNSFRKDSSSPGPSSKGQGCGWRGALRNSTVRMRTLSWESIRIPQCSDPPTFYLPLLPRLFCVPPHLNPVASLPPRTFQR